MVKKLDFLQGKFVEDTPAKRRSAPEAAVGRVIDDYLRLQGAYIRQINSGGVRKVDGTWKTSGQGSGISDRLCWLPNGKFIAVELKAPGKKRTATEMQLLFLERIIERGHVGCVADCVEDVRLALSQTKEQLLFSLNSLKPKPRDPTTLAPLFP